MEKLCILNLLWLTIRSRLRKILNLPLTKKEKAILLPPTKWWFLTRTPKDPLLFHLSWLKLTTNPSSSNSGSVRTENLKAVPTLQGHHHRAGLSCLVTHKFQGIPSQFPKAISTILDILISQGLMLTLLRQVTDQFFAFWELDNYVLTVGKSEGITCSGSSVSNMSWLWISPVGC